MLFTLVSVYIHKHIVVINNNEIGDKWKLFCGLVCCKLQEQNQRTGSVQLPGTQGVMAAAAGVVHVSLSPRRPTAQSIVFNPTTVRLKKPVQVL